MTHTENNSHVPVILYYHIHLAQTMHLLPYRKVTCYNCYRIFIKLANILIYHNVIIIISITIIVIFIFTLLLSYYYYCFLFYGNYHNVLFDSKEIYSLMVIMAQLVNPLHSAYCSLHQWIMTKRLHSFLVNEGMEALLERRNELNG